MNRPSSPGNSNKIANKNIGLFGSSFNPPHNGHLAVIQDLATRQIFDEIWLIPVFQHAFGKSLAPFDHRLNMLEILVDEIGHPHVHISTIERELNKQPSYTFDVVTELKRRYPTHHFHLIIGSDIMTDLHKWHRIDELRALANFYKIPRIGFEISPYPNVSSSQIRNALGKCQDVTLFVPQKIAEYIEHHHLYHDY